MPTLYIPPKNQTVLATVTRDAEPKLIDLATKIRDEARDWTAVQFNFSGLQDHYRSDYQLKIAVNMAGDQLKSMQGGIYVCRDCTIFVLFPRWGKRILAQSQAK